MDAGYESDSDFYGEGSYAMTSMLRTTRLTGEGQIETVARLKRQLQLAETDVYRARAYQTAVDGGADVEQKPVAVGRQPLQNPYAGIAYAWQLGESIDDFLCRLPPATTVKDQHTPWIYVCNPYVERKKKPQSEGQSIPGCEDEGPETEESHPLLFVEGARERLNLLGGFLGGMARMGLPRERMLQEAETARQAAVKDILGLAGLLGVTSGKWMLFVRPGRVNKVWETVARATCRGELGTAAKVAPRDPAVNGQDEAQQERLVCIYTGDFRDANDVGRVLRRLEALGLVQRRQRGNVYYKSDAYTYLGIGANNPWGLRASLFSSSDVFTWG